MKEKNKKIKQIEVRRLRINKNEIVFIILGVLFAALPYLYPTDFLFFRFPFFVFIAFEFGIRAGLITTLPVAVINIFLTPQWENLNTGETAVMSAVIISGPIAALIAAKIKRYDKLQKKFIPVLGLFILCISYELYLWMQEQANIFKIPIICTIALVAYFLFRYRKYIDYVRAFLWILMFYYFASFLIYIPLTRFSIDAPLFFSSLLSLFPADILAVILGGAVLPQLKTMLDAMKEDNAG
jgi:hypothetical protein